MSAYDDIIRAALIKMRDDGLTRREAAKELGTSYQGFASRLSRMGIDWPHAASARIPSERNRQILARHDAGEEHPSIAAAFGITRERVRQIVKANGRKPRTEMRRDEFEAIVEAVRNLPPMSSAEAVAALGFSYHIVWAAASEAGVKFRKRDSETTAMLAELAEKVKAGASFNSAAGGDHALAGLLKRYCDENGIKTSAPCRWTVDPGMRRRVIAEMRAEGHSWDKIAAAISSNEGVRKIGGASIHNWVRNNAPYLAAIKPPKKDKPSKPARRSYPSERKCAKAAPADARVIIAGDVRETAIANYGKAPASKIAKELGVSRNSIIGHWFRARQSGEIAA